MSELTVASRYAKSLIDLAEELNSLEQVKQDVDLFIKTLKASHELQVILRNPIIPQDKKIHILEALFFNKVQKATDSFFRIMVNKGRSYLLAATAEEFVNQYDAKKNIIKAKVVSASPLSASNKQMLIDEIKTSTNGNIELETKVDPNLIGGFILTIGDKQVDTSIAGGLNRLKQDFSKRVSQ